MIWAQLVKILFSEFEDSKIAEEKGLLLQLMDTQWRKFIQV